MKEKVTGAKIWGLIYPQMLYSVISYIFVFATTIVLTAVLMIQDKFNISNMSDTQAIQQMTIDVTNMLASNMVLITLWAALVTLPILILFRYRDIENDKLNNRFRKYEGVSPFKYLLVMVFAIFCMLSANYFVSILTMFMPSSMTDSYEDVSSAIYGSSMFIQILAGAIVCPIVEELINRALVYNRIKKMTGIMPAAILSSLLFGAFHGNWVQAPYAFLIGMACVYVYEKYKSIAAPMILHMTANLFSVLISRLASQTTKQASTVEVSAGSQLLVLAIVMLITAGLAFAVSKVINKVVNPKEIIQ